MSLDIKQFTEEFLRIDIYIYICYEAGIVSK